MKKNGRYILSIIGRIVVALLLFWALDKHPYSYYQLLRVITCAVGIYMAYSAWELEKKFWLISFAIIAIVFNPLIPVHLDKYTWSYIDVISGVFFIVSIFFVKEKQKYEH